MPSASAAAGYASDDECEARQLPDGYGALPGDTPAKRKLSRTEVLEYGVRQNSAGPVGKKTRFLDAVLGSGHRLAPSQTTARKSFEHHVALLSLIKQSKVTTMKSDLSILRESHRFLREEADDDGSWEARLAKRYYDRLFKEYVMCDLSGYRQGNVGFRWRTEAEVVRGTGQFSCGHKRCESKAGLNSYEVDFKYSEAGANKRALVKVRLCQDCAFKLHYRRLKAARKKRKKEQKEGRSVESTAAEEEVKDECPSTDNEKPQKPDGSLRSEDEPKGATEQASESEKRLLESLAWRGPDPEAKTREDDMDDYLRDLFM